MHMRIPVHAYMHMRACVHACILTCYLLTARLLVRQCIPDAIGAHDESGAAPTQDIGGHDSAQRGDGRDGSAAVDVADPAADLLAVLV